ncbi:MAG: glycosyltransferase [Floccifex sp.]
MERIAVIMGKMHSGGKKNLVMEYYRHIDRSKIQFDFICDEDSNAIPTEEIETLGGRVYVVPRYQNILANIKAIEKICKENKYKIVHGYNGTMNIFGLYAAWRAGVPVRVNESISMAHKSDKKTILKNILRPFSRCFATHFMANGEACGKWQFGKLYDAGKVAIFKTVINTDDNQFQPELRNKCREEFGLEDNLVIGHIGRLTAQKNTLFILDIFAKILKIEEKAKLLIIGDGDLRDDMQKKIEDLEIKESVLYLGRREDIKQFYNAMDGFLLPSLYEGLPVVGIEAECCGLPVFFSTEIPEESSPCSDIGTFIGLNKSATEWAEITVEKIKQIERKDHSKEVKEAGFDSVTEAGKLLGYYEGLKKQSF